MKTLLFIISYFFTTHFCSAQESGVLIDSTVFHCNYKISFLGNTVEYGVKFSYSTDRGKISSDSFLIGDMGKFTNDSLRNRSADEVVVLSCDGKVKYEIASVWLQYFIVNDASVTPLTYIAEGAVVNLKKAFEIHNEFEKITIVLQGITEPLELYILIGVDPEK